MENKTWCSGKNNYRCATLDYHTQTFTLELIDVEQDQYQDIHEVLADHVSHKQTKYVDVLYSGGIDSEMTIISLKKQNVPLRAYTLRFLLNSYPINTHDLYYSEKFCRKNKINHTIIDLDIEQFFETTYADYLDPYGISQFHVATHFWLIEQLSGFPVLGGDYFWPWIEKKIYSPQRYNYNCYDLYMADKGIHGIGNMLGHSTESSKFFIESHHRVYEHNVADGTFKKIPILKHNMAIDLNYGYLDIRKRSYGWENLELLLWNPKKLNRDLVEKYGEYKSVIKWNNNFAKFIDGEVGTNDQF
jgi:hypothetical protein